MISDMLKKLCFALLLLLVMPAWHARALAAEPIKVAASIFPLADIVRQVGKERVSVVTLLPAGASEHAYEPTASQMRQAADAALYVRVGAGMDVWVDRLMAAARHKPLVITATGGIPLLQSSSQDLLLKDGKGEHEHDHGNGDDPHVWLDPTIVRDHILPAVTEALARLSPADARVFKVNSRRYALELTRLDMDYTNTLSKLPKRNFIAMHSAWGYLARKYQLKQVAAVETFPGKEPSAKYIAALIKKARELGVTTIFAEPQLSNKAARVIAAELGGKVLVLDPLGSAQTPGRNSYLALMRHNLSILAGGLH